MPFKDRMDPAKRTLARRMYRKPTPSEKALWERLKGRQLGVPFLSQECMLGYVVDFYCPKANLAIAVDGGVHETPEHRAYDAERDRVLRRHGIKVLRIPAGAGIDEAIARIDLKLTFLQVPRTHAKAAPKERTDKAA
jgi:very-short-patch-repair endonuclease